uniref:Receptor-like serine/threonine-protein kinase n=1 Tax=Fagus sylvatica TaxID=28930 RepID=A0A2N9J971_FAGSY
MDIFAFVFLSSCSLVFLSGFSDAADSITQSQSFSEGMTLVSKDGSFELGFFSPSSSKNRYLGIWYKNIPVQTVVWVANRLNPINDSSGVLMASNPIVQLLDSGNLVVRDEKEENPENYLWQSFDYLCDTLVPGMKIGWNSRNGLEWRLSAWKSPDDPSPGDLTYGIENHNYPELVMKKGSEKYFRTGPWNGHGNSGLPELKANSVFKYDFVSNKDEVYYILHMVNTSVISILVLNQTSNLFERFIWVEADKKLSVYSSYPKDNCDKYNLCGVYGICMIGESPICQCLEGFKPKSQETWNPDEWSKGCVRTAQLSCQDKDKIGFDKFVGLKLPDTTYTWVNGSMNLEECRVKCLNNCSCTAYSNLYIRDGGSGCAIWYGDLIDIRQMSANGQDLYIRMSASKIPASSMNHGKAKKGGKTKIAVVVAAAALAFVFGMLLIGFYICRSRTNLKVKLEWNRILGHQNNEGKKEEDLELPFLDLSTIASATNNFAINNKLGEGGFGPVYKGTLEDGQEIAVKRLSRNSKQGLNEFKNEVKLIAKLQHRNLVKLLAYFGLARTFGGDQLEGNTNRVVGTYGYMAPEYAFDGQFSTKSDVFSFGILLLEIISGKRSRGFYHPDHTNNLIGSAWILWNEDRPLELIDECLGKSCPLSEVLRCIHLSLLCVQQRPEDRPSMSSVVVVLGSESALPQPKKPGFFLEKKSNEAHGFSSKQELPSINEITNTLLEAR